MRVIKPLRLSILQRVVTLRRAHHLSVGLSVFFPFEAPEIALMEVAMWQQAMKVLGKDAALDEGNPKPRGEVLVLGKAFSPGGQPRPVFAPRVQVGSVDKTVMAVGRRRWSLTGPTEPEPITEMPLTWEKAFGGPGYEPNPAGMGLSPVEEAGGKVHYLPHLEDPKHLMKSPDDRPMPASFGPLDPTLSARIAKMGTYGKKWVETEFPGYAHDLDPEYFQVAPEDQRLPDYFQGGEPIVLENLHPSKPRIETRVPRLRARCFATRKTEAGEEPLLELITRLETVILLPNIERGIALFRCMLDITEDDAGDVTVLLCALEKPDAPKSFDHYREVLAKRLDKEKRHLYSMKESDLLPEPEAGAPSFPEESLGDMKELIAREGSLEKRVRARKQSEIDKMRLSARVLGVDPDERGIPLVVSPPEKPPKMDKLAEYIEGVQAQAAEQRASQDLKRKDAEERARKMCAEHGIDFDALREKRKREGAGPPKFRADEQLARMREIVAVGRKAGMPMEPLEEKIEDPAYLASLRKTERTLRFMYRRSVHFTPPSPPLDAEAQARGRAEVERAIEAGESLAGRDLSGLDLRGANLAKANLVEALLDGADLSGCDLSGADLSGTVLAHAKLAGAKLDGARLTGANLGEADASGTSFEGLCLENVEFYKARLAGARFARADLRKAKFFETIFAGADLTGADASEAIFLRADIAGARFGGAKLKKAVFVQCTGGQGIDFGGATLEEAAFVAIRAEKASFLGARAVNLRVVGDSALPEANFAGADLCMANFRGVDLSNAIFEGARADGADFSESRLHGARLVSMSAKGARFIRADLTGADMTGSNLIDALLMKAKLAGARVERANLYRANFLDAKGDDKTSFSESHVKRVLFMRKD